MKDRQPPLSQSSTAPNAPKLLDQVKRCIRDKHYSLRTEEAYVYWIRWFIRFHKLRHPAEMGAVEVRAFLSYLSNERSVSVSTHKQALCALLFLYKQVLQSEFPWLDDLHRPNRLPRLPTVLTQSEVSCVLAKMRGLHSLMARLLYGTGMRRMECMIRFGKGGKDRVTMLPLSLMVPLKEQIAAARTVYDSDQSANRTDVMLPDALERKYPRAATQWGWFWVFPSAMNRPIHDMALYDAIKCMSELDYKAQQIAP